MKHKFKIL